MLLRKFGALVVAAVLPLIALAQQSTFVGDWLLWVESGYEDRPAYGRLAIGDAGEEFVVYVEGGPVKLLELDGNRIH